MSISANPYQRVAAKEAKPVLAPAHRHKHALKFSARAVLLLVSFLASLSTALAGAASELEKSKLSARTNSNSGSAAPVAGFTLDATNRSPALPRMEVNEAVMVTVELDFGPRVPSVAEALREIERKHQPDDGKGRVFAILDAYGEPTPDGKKLHLSMHVSSEKTGTGALVFRRTGEVLWESRVVS